MIKEVKDKTLRIRISSKDYDILEEVARENNISLSKYIRLILDQAILLIQTERVNVDENK